MKPFIKKPELYKMPPPKPSDEIIDIAYRQDMIKATQDRMYKHLYRVGKITLHELIALEVKFVIDV